MKKGIRKTLSITITLAIIFQMLIPIIPELNIEVFAADETSENTEEISRDYEIKEEETWDISKNSDGTVTAKWTLKDRTLTISGTGKMKDWNINSEGDWHNTQYRTIIENVVIKKGVTNIGNAIFYGCMGLKNVNIPEDVTNIGNSAFHECRTLRKVILSKSIKEIGEYAFFRM